MKYYSKKQKLFSTVITMSQKES